jgi:hypothetical protein
MPTKSIFFPLWFAICRRIRKQSAAKEKKKRESEGETERGKETERKRNFKRGILNVELLLSRPLRINFTQALPAPPTNYLLRANRWQHTPTTISIKLREIEFGRRYNKVIFFICFILFYMRVCFVLTVSSLPYSSDCFKVVHFRERNTKKREALSQNFLTVEHFLSVLHFLFGLFISANL